MALECGHKFCQYCIERWQSRAPGGELNCPNCRKKVTAFHPDITVDNLIESLFRDLSDQQQKDRRDTIEERQSKSTSPTEIHSTYIKPLLLQNHLILNCLVLMFDLQKIWKSLDETQFLQRPTALRNCLSSRLSSNPKTVMIALIPEIAGKEGFLYTTAMQT